MLMILCSIDVARNVYTTQWDGMKRYNIQPTQSSH